MGKDTNLGAAAGRAVRHNHFFLEIFRSYFFETLIPLPTQSDHAQEFD